MSVEAGERQRVPAAFKKHVHGATRPLIRRGIGDSSTVKPKVETPAGYVCVCVCVRARGAVCLTHSLALLGWRRLLYHVTETELFIDPAYDGPEDTKVAYKFGACTPLTPPPQRSRRRARPRL